MARMTETDTGHAAASSSPSAAPPARTPLHTRHVTCEAFERADGLIDIEARLQDISPPGTQLLYKSLPPGGVMHDLTLAVTIDRDMLIHDARAIMHTAPIPGCTDIEAAYARLKGLHIRPGFRQRVKSLVGGTLGCTHLNELLTPLATIAMQARMAIARRGRTEIALGTGPMPQPAIINTCHTYRESSAASARIWPLERRV